MPTQHASDRPPGAGSASRLFGLSRARDIDKLNAFWALAAINDALGLDVKPESIGRVYRMESGRENRLMVSKSATTSYFAQNW